MSWRQLCPGCESATSTVRGAFERGAACPYCGLPADVAVQVLEVRERLGDEQLRRELEAALKRAAAVELERDDLRRRLRLVQDALREPGPSSEPPRWAMAAGEPADQG